MQSTRNHESNEDERRYFDLVDPGSDCTKNLVDQGNSKSNLVSLRHAIIRAAQAYQIAPSCLDTWQRQPHTQPQQ
jgi:hypothetical protein